MTAVLHALPSVRKDDRTRRWLLRGGDEVFRAIYTRAKVERREVIAVTSATHGEGRTTIAIGLATTIAQDFPDRRIVIVETDLEQPVLARDLAISPRPGLIDCLVAGRLDPDAIRTTALDNLCVIPSGGPVSATERLLRSQRMVALVGELRHAFDVVVIDTPPILTNSDGAPVVALADGALLVVRAGLASVEQVERAVAEIEPVKLRGTVLNGAHSAVPQFLRRLFGLGTGG